MGTQRHITAEIHSYYNKMQGAYLRATDGTAVVQPALKLPEECMVDITG
jgi:hypothetical protein